MFKIVPHPTFACTVRLSVPGSDTPATIGVTFRHKTTRELDRWLKSATQNETDAQFLAEVMEDWTGVCGADDKPLAYSQSALAQLLDAHPSAGPELLIAYRRQLADARAKN